MRALRGVADDRHLCVDQQVEPVEGLLGGGAAFQPLDAGIDASGQRSLHNVRRPREIREHWLIPEVEWVVGKEIHSRRLAGIALIATWWHRAEELKPSSAGQQVVGAVDVESEPVDFLVQTAGVREERLAHLLVRGVWASGGVVPRLATQLTRGIWQQVEPVVRMERYPIDGSAAIHWWLRVEPTRRIQPSVRRSVEIGRIALERMSTELVHIYG